jgi:hypothetical protein
MLPTDLDECKERLACTCPDCQCKNTWGNYECKCKGNQLYIRGEDVCIGKRKVAELEIFFLYLHSFDSAKLTYLELYCHAANDMSRLGWFITILVVSCVTVTDYVC